MQSKGYLETCPLCNNIGPLLPSVSAPRLCTALHIEQLQPLNGGGSVSWVALCCGEVSAPIGYVMFLRCLLSNFFLELHLC